MSEEPEEKMRQLIREDGRYPLEAFNFLNDGLARAVKRVHGAGGKSKPRHVTGQELAEALRDEAMERWGLLAKTVLAKWNIHATIDFGNMVYLLVNNDLMQKTDQDSLEDFRDVYDFDEAFNRFYMPEA
jgi:uncharacterized repeat protein (TIGR04138 family)